MSRPKGEGECEGWVLRRGEGEMDDVRGSTGGKKRTGRMLSRGEGEAGRRTGGGGKRAEWREGGREEGSSDLSNQADLSSAQ